MDISDYIIPGTELVPRISRNRDFSLRLETWKVIIAGSLRDVRGSTYNFTAGDKFRVYDGSNNIRFYGVVDKSIYNYEDNVFEVTVKDGLYLLSQKLVEYNSLHTAISGGTPAWYEYVASDEYGYPDVGLIHVVKKMFSEVGYTLDVTDVDSEVLLTYDFGGAIGNVNIEYQKLLMDENVMYCINQNVAAYHTKIDDLSYEYNSDKITFFDFVSEVCSILGLGIELTSLDNYKLIRAAGSSNYVVADDDKFSYQSSKVDGKRTINDLGTSYNLVNRSEYQSTTPTDLTIRSTKHGSGINRLTNFTIFFTDIDVNDPYSTVGLAITDLNGDVSPDTSIEEGSGIYNYNELAYKVRAEVSDYTDEELLTNDEDDYETVIENFFDVEWENSQIKQETY